VSGATAVPLTAPRARFWEFLRAGWDRRSLVALGLLFGVGGLVGYRWSDLIDPSGGMDWLLAGTWLWMAAMLTWRVSLRRDLVFLAVGFVGGGVIEWWGTYSRIWTYFTLERPPLWILPAWPIATLAIDRMARILDHAVEQVASPRGAPVVGYWLAYWICVPSFVVAMIAFSRHTMHIVPTQVVVSLMIGVTLACRDPRRDFTLFAAGSLLGIFLEYWGTSRQCWTYYTEQVPPPVATVAHGFAAIAFARGADAMNRVLDGARERFAQSPA
jgi:hypothetical protein